MSLIGGLERSTPPGTGLELISCQWREFGGLSEAIQPPRIVAGVCNAPTFELFVGHGAVGRAVNISNAYNVPRLALIALITLIAPNNRKLQKKLHKLLVSEIALMNQQNLIFHAFSLDKS
jgi:hypothetical protein